MCVRGGEVLIYQREVQTDKATPSFRGKGRGWASFRGVRSKKRPVCTTPLGTTRSHVSFLPFSRELQRSLQADRSLPRGCRLWSWHSRIFPPWVHAIIFFSFLPGSFLCWVLPSNPQSPKDQNYLEVPVSAEGRKKQSLPPFLLSRDQIFMYAVPSVCNTFPSLLCLANS